MKSFLIFLSLMFYLCVSKRYHYRHRDEVVNEQYLVEEIYERNLDLEEEYERQKREEMRALLENTQDGSKYYCAANNIAIYKHNA